MLLALWPAFIQHQRSSFGFVDLGGNKREENGPIAENENAGLDRAERTSIEPSGIELLGVSGHDGGIGASGNTATTGVSDAENGIIQIGIDNTMRRKREDEALFLILASL